jgi:hypothetical protein
MAQMLVCNNRRAAPNSQREPGWWRTGDIVLIRVASHEWGTEELNTDKFRIVRIPGMTVSELRAYVHPRRGIHRSRFRVNFQARQIIDKDDGSVVLSY